MWVGVLSVRVWLLTKRERCATRQARLLASAMRNSGATEPTVQSRPVKVALSFGVKHTHSWLVFAQIRRRLSAGSS